MLEKSVGPDNGGIQGLLGQGKHFNLLPQSIEKPLNKGTSNEQICILKRYLCCDKNGLEMCRAMHPETYQLRKARGRSRSGKGCS